MTAQGRGGRMRSRREPDVYSVTPYPVRSQAHPIPTLPSNVRRGGVPYTREWLRTDPGYDQPGPPRRSDLSWQRFIEGFIVFAAIVLFVFLASLVEAGS